MLGVASIALRAAGCTWPAASADPISRWELDETSSASVLFEDHGPAFVRMMVTGVWPDMTTGSLVEGAEGTSAYTDGSAYATIPGGEPAHDLAALTISFYYQRASADDKQVLLAAGNGAQPGDFSIEVLANGRLRAWHTGQDGALLFFGDTTGIAGTDLQVNTAHRIDLSLGLQGARIYMDGAELAAIPANTNGWNNTRDKYLARWTDGVLAPADGAFDRIRLWNRQLANAEIAQLEPAQPTTLPVLPEQPAPTSDELVVPSLAEWLPSDAADPVPTKYVSSQNRGNGSGSSPSNAQAVQAALNSASPGDLLLAVCQTPGTIEHWDCPNGLSFPSGTSGNYITLQAREGDGVVINAGGEYAGARTPSSGFWTQSGLSQDDIDKQIWRSTATLSGGGQDMIGMWVEFDHVHQLMRYASMANLRAPYGTADSFTNYAGPGVHQDSDGRLYIRFQRPHPGKYSARGTWQKSLWRNNPEAVNGNGELVYPISEDPNDYVIYIAKASPGNLHAFRPASGAGNGYFKIGPGINSCMFRRFMQGGAQHIRVDRGTHLVWQVGIIGQDGNYALDWFVNRARFSDGSKRHAARAEWKFGGPLEGIRSVFMTPMARMQNICFKDCTFADFHEFGTFAAGNSSADGQIRFRNCCFFNCVDEGFQGRVGASRFEWGYCYFLNAGIFGPGINGVEDAEWDPGKWFIHHCIFDLRVQNCFDWRKNPGPQKLFAHHSPDQNQPKKIYNNTIFWGPDQEERFQLGLQHLNGNNVTVTGTDAAHEVFNNIIIRHDLQRYNIEYSNNFQVQSDFVCGRMNVDGNKSNEYWDYNLYYRDVPLVDGDFVDGLLSEVSEGHQNAYEDFSTVAAFRSSDKFALSKQGGSRRGAYTPGFEANGSDTKPALASLDSFPDGRFQYRPGATPAVMTATTASLSGANWWSSLPTWGADDVSWSAEDGSLQPSPWKGALDPNGSTMPVGVQNP